MRNKLIVAGIFFFVVLNFFSWNILFSLEKELMEVVFFDVGQGDATFLQGPDFNILIDAGQHNRTDVISYLHYLDVQEIKLLIGTHPHADHIGQFPEIIRDFNVREVWLSGDIHTTRTFERTIDALLASDAEYNEPRSGEIYTIGSARLEVLNPEYINDNFHEGCISLRVVYGNVSFLFTGDIESKTERDIVNRHDDITSTVLQLGHHGSRTSSSSLFLQAVKPQIAIYSAAADNQYGHPHDETIENLLSFGVDVLGTDIYGTIRLITDGVQILIEKEYSTYEHLWD